MRLLRLTLLLPVCALVIAFRQDVRAQIGSERYHTRGKLWEDVQNDGFIGSLGAWDYNTTAPLGLYPGFKGYNHPSNGEIAVFSGGWDNSNMHDFKSGVWVVVKTITVPGLPPDYVPQLVPYETYTSGQEANAYGVETIRQPLDFQQNFLESTTFDPLMPEELISGTWNTCTGITVTRRSYTWGFPGYRDFIIYDYTFKNTGIMVSSVSGSIVPGFPDTTLSRIRFVFTSGVSVSTKSQINFHTDLDGQHWASMAAGGFGYDQAPTTFHDFYHLEDNGTLMYSTNFNGGKEPLYGWDTWTLRDLASVKARFGNELMSPAAFGWVALYADPLPLSAPRTTPKPDVLRIDSDGGGKLNGQPIDFEHFRLGAGSSTTKKMLYDFASSPDTQAALGNDGHRYNWYTLSYGPYTLAPGDSVRIILAEIAGVMDYNDVIAGDPNGHFPDSTLAAIRRNAQNCRNAVKWGIGARVNGIPLAADVPEPPPAPVTDCLNASSADTAILAVSWGKIAETTTIFDHSGAVFYDGLNDLDGYRVYRSSDFQYTSDQTPPAFRGAAWTLVADIPKSQFGQFWDASIGNYKYLDRTVTFGYQYAYYVAGYRTAPKPWTSANNTLVPNLPPLESGDYNHSVGTKAAAGPAYDLDVFTVPNPYIYGDQLHSFSYIDPYSIEFRKLPDICTIRIYTISGDLVRVLEHAPDARGNISGTEVWNQRTDSGILVAPGLYIYHVESKTPAFSGSKTAKTMIIR